MAEPLVLIDDPAPRVRRLTLNRPTKRNALSHGLRTELFDALRSADRSPDVGAVIIRGAGSCFSAGYDLAQDPGERPPWTISPADGGWARHVLQGWFEMMDLSIPLVAQVHGYCLAGGTELATACDLVYVADDAEIGYPPVRSMSSPDMGWHVWLMGMRRAMEAMLTGDSMSGAEAVEAGFANRAFAAAELDAEVLAVAERIVKVPADLQALNKRVVHRAMESMGMRNGMRATADINAIGFHQPSSIEYHRKFAEGVTSALTARDDDFGDYRTKSD
ncbi:enoyl-CoA hydratase-related protein [Ilumatobacter coccineus]|uniref:Putative enoyl-CoA hydratase n=1 Tax=Ilumatobacter coccineus (strain NBRC 103263 / KCTC 29153 / YM16-304) TaxID=1313172 RepID=A0A6C7EHD4_ILUCY|nr:enoyl-CoA hydratase-related protein [Ilumatobacter coccineus]BAN03386.1 putative enoyl-CoA hydratase [Ilumatobacter coccineus YM16-304]